MQLSDKQSVSDMRSAYGQTLVELGLNDQNFVCVGADTTDSLKTKKFGDKFPNRLFNVGIAEANLVSIAAGLAIAGKVVFASTYAAFLPGRCLDQIRNTICYPFLNVKLVVSHAGLNCWTRWCIASTNRRHFYDENNPKHESSCAMQMQYSVKNLMPTYGKNSRTFLHASCSTIKHKHL